MVLKHMPKESEDTTLFENDVKTYGTETYGKKIQVLGTFENDVKTYGTETLCLVREFPSSLRMM